MLGGKAGNRGPSSANPLSRQKTVTEEVRSWIELFDVGGGQRIPAAMQSAFMFRKEYVHQYLLPAIALHRQPDLQLERARRQLVEKLSDENKIPAMLQ